MKILLKLAQAIDGLNDRVGRSIYWLILLMVIIIFSGLVGVDKTKVDANEPVIIEAPPADYSLPPPTFKIDPDKK